MLGELRNREQTAAHGLLRQFGSISAAVGLEYRPWLAESLTHLPSSGPLTYN